MSTDDLGDALAAEMRRVDGTHSMGTGELADRLLPVIAAHVEAERADAARTALQAAADAWERRLTPSRFRPSPFTSQFLRARADEVSP